MGRKFDIFAHVRAWERRLLPMLGAARIVELVGLVDEEGVIGRMDVNGDWNAKFCCPIWRIVGGPLQERDMAIRRPVTYQEFTWYRRNIRPDSIVRVRGRLVDRRRMGIPQLLLESFEGQDFTDVELIEEREKYIGSVTIDDPVFGTITFDSSRGEFWTIADWCDEPARLDLDAEKKPAARRALNKARDLWENQKDWNDRVWQCLTDELFPLKNKNWLCEGESPVSLEEFRERITINAINVTPEGAFEFWFDDGFLFLDHSIVVEGSIEAGVTDADLVG